MIILRTDDDLATSGDINAAVATLTAQHEAMQAALTALAADGLDDATTGQVNAARDAILAAIEANATIGAVIS